jgi:signal peptidase I
MANTIIPGDHLVVRKRAFGKIDRGDIIVFSQPQNTSVRFVSRVIGLPQETIEIRGMAVFINGNELREQRVMVKPDNLDGNALQEFSTEGNGPYRVYYSSRAADDQSGVPSELEKGKFGTDGPFRIPANEYFVMGDNRDNSFDSRYWGTVPRPLVFGKPTMIYWSSRRDSEGNESVKWDRIFRKITNY